MGWRRGQAYGPELRGRVLAACDSGASVREVAERLMVGPSYVVKVRQRRDDTGETQARRGTGRPPAKLTTHLVPLRERVSAQPDATLGEPQGWLLAERGVAVSPVTVWRALAGLGLTLKKGSVGNSVCVRSVERHGQAMARVKRWPKSTANWAFAMARSRGGILHSRSVLFKTR